MAQYKSNLIRFSLRSLFLIITLIAVWGGYHSNRAARERAAIAVLVRHDGTVRSKSPLPASLLEALSGGYGKFSQYIWKEPRIVDVRLQSSMEPEVVAALIALPNLESLSLNPPPPSFKEHEAWRLHRTPPAAIPMPVGIVDKILASRKLNSLAICSFVLNDEDFRAICRQQQLESLRVCGTNLSEFQLAELSQLPRLKSLYFTHCQVKGTELVGLPGSKTLERIDCDYTPVGVGLASFVCRSPNVRDLGIFGAPVDDEFVRKLGAHPTVTGLSLSHSSITDRSLTTLIQMRSLKTVDLPQQTVTKGGIDKLKRSRPGLRITP